MKGTLSYTLNNSFSGSSFDSTSATSRNSSIWLSKIPSLVFRITLPQMSFNFIKSNHILILFSLYMPLSLTIFVKHDFFENWQVWQSLIQLYRVNDFVILKIEDFCIGWDPVWHLGQTLAITVDTPTHLTTTKIWTTIWQCDQCWK